ncbi:MAG TPA: polysaccharide deacetylase family protein [Luteibaculaceae bacterium]|nr:polysaccharide deacetylase family protein [Luteibaculaceae bacterium]
MNLSFQRVPKLLESSIQRIVENPAVVLIYHRVAHLESDPQLLNVSPEHFEAQVKWLKKNTHLLTVEEFTHIKLNGDKFPKRSTLITFDDGYFDNCQFARPILESYQAQGLFYITTQWLNTHHELWWDELERLFLIIGLKLKPNALDHLPQANDAPQWTGDSMKDYEHCHRWIKWKQPEDRDTIIGHLRFIANVDESGRESHRMMNWGELAVMAQSKSVVLGAHTHQHAPLSTLNPQRQRDDILESKKILEAFTKRQIIHFSYPFGGEKDFNQHSVLIAEQLGFRLVCANYPGVVFRHTSNYEIPRMLVRNWELGEFSQQINQFFRF